MFIKNDMEKIIIIGGIAAGAKVRRISAMAQI